MLRTVTMEQSLPSSWYRRSEIFELERRQIFSREWYCVCRASELAGPGSHRVVDVAGSSVLVLRNAQGDLRAFHNTCRHRGAQLCTPPGFVSHHAPLGGGVVGARTIVCPYHAWTYDLDGRLLRAPFLGRDDGFDASRMALHAVAVGQWGGFVFVNLGEAPTDLAAAMATYQQRYERYPLADLETAETLVYDVAANWKIICENYNECYHCGPVHPELCALVPAFRERGGAGLDWQRGIPHRPGADTFTRSGLSDRRSFPGLNADEQQRHKGELIYPNLFISLAREHVAAFILEPLGATRTRISCLFLFETYEMSRAQFCAADAIEFWDVVNRQDWAICEAVQRGIASPRHGVGLLAPMEDWNLDIRRYVTERIGDAAAQLP
ncbi:MAG: aromatic ring-hydroxylating dioxygenase subunit alpha [Steroidobacteraceae bacterium]